MAFAEDLLHGKRHDHALKALCRAGNAISAMDTWPGLSEALDDVKSLLAAEQKEGQKAQQAPPDENAAGPDIVLKLTKPPDDNKDKGNKEVPTEINMSDLGEEERAEWQRPRDFLKQQLNNYIHILVYDECADIAKAVPNTPAGKFEGVAQSVGTPDSLASRGTPG